MASSSRTALPSAVLALRLLTLALLAASLAVIAADKLTLDFGGGLPPKKITFKDVNAYRSAPSDRNHIHIYETSSWLALPAITSSSITIVE